MFFGYQIELEIVNGNWLRKEKQGFKDLIPEFAKLLMPVLGRPFGPATKFRDGHTEKIEGFAIKITRKYTVNFQRSAIATKSIEFRNHFA